MRTLQDVPDPPPVARSGRCAKALPMEALLIGLSLFTKLQCAGGTALLTGLRDRLERELAELAPHTAKVKVTSPANALERRFSVWIGARTESPCMQCPALLFAYSVRSACTQCPARTLTFASILSCFRGTGEIEQINAIATVIWQCMHDCALAHWMHTDSKGTES